MRAILTLATAAALSALPFVAHAQNPPQQNLPFAQRFADANTTHDGCLTLDQAKAGGLNGIVQQFQEIDIAKKGCVTMKRIGTFVTQRRKQQQQPQ